MDVPGRGCGLDRAFKVASTDKETQEEVGIAIFKTGNDDMGADGAAECMRTTGNEKQK